MHKSRLAGIIIDCQTEDLPAAAQFWSAALGMREKHAQGRYVEFDDADRELHVEVQAVEHPSRVHIDIETDDIEAEVLRLEALGAKRLQAVKTWVVMEAPTGQRFCVVRVQSREESFESGANVWD